MAEIVVKVEQTAESDAQGAHSPQWSSDVKIEDGFVQGLSQWGSMDKQEEVANVSGQESSSHYNADVPGHDQGNGGYSAEGYSSCTEGNKSLGAGHLTQGYPGHREGFAHLEAGPGPSSQQSLSQPGCTLLDIAAPSPSLEMLSQRGAIIKVLNGYKYTFQKILANGITRFKCHKNNCRAFIKVRGNTIVEGNMDHTHPPVDDKVLQRQVLSNSVKRKAVFRPDEKPSKLMKEAAETVQLNVSDMSKRDIEYVRRILHRSRSVAKSKWSQDWPHPYANMPLPLEIRLGDQAKPSQNTKNQTNLDDKNHVPPEIEGASSLIDHYEDQNDILAGIGDTRNQVNPKDQDCTPAELREIKTESITDEPTGAPSELENTNTEIKLEDQTYFASVMEDTKRCTINIQDNVLPHSVASSPNFDLDAMHNNSARKRKAVDSSMTPPIKVKNSLSEDRSSLPNKFDDDEGEQKKLGSVPGGSSGQLFGSDGNVLNQWGAKRSYGAVMPKPPATLSGIDHLTNPSLNKGMGFSLHERQVLGIHGLLPPCYRDQEKQMQLIRHNVDKFTEPINKYTYLMGVLERNEKLFFRFLSENVEDMMPIVYTPTVGLACQNYGLILRAPRGLFITIHDKGNVLEVLNNWPESEVKAIVVTDGERILGLGDLGAYGMGIPVGKLALFTVLAKVDPRQCLPVTLDVGTNNQQLLDDPFYIGLKQKRVTGREYDEFIEEFMQACVKRFGRNCLIQFEDFGNHNAFRLLHKYQKEYCTFNDDIQGTAAVCVAGVLASLRATKTRLSDHTIVFQGAGEASLGIAELCVKAMKAEGTADADARAKIFLVDSKGLIVKDRLEGGISEHKAKFAHPRAPIKTLTEVVKALKPTILIGAAAIGGAFTPEILQTMAANNKQPVIFALSNPTSKAECTAEDAYKHTNGKCLFASGSPFQPVTIDGKTHYPGQGNNSYIFPGVALGVISAGIRHIDEDLFLLSAQSLSNIVTDADLEIGALYPPLKNIQDCSLKIAVKLVESAYKTGIASVRPEPEDKEAFIKSQLYDYYYSSAVPKVYDWPTKL